MQLNKIFPLNDESKKIEFHLFEIAIFLTIIVLTFGSILGFINDFELINQIIFLFGVIAYTSIYIAQKKEVPFKIVTTVYFGLSFVLIILGWLPSGGIEGPILQFIVLIFISGLLVLPIKSFIGFVILTALVVFSFSIYEYNDPSVALAYTDSASRIRDLSISGVMTIFVLGFSLYTFKRTYVRDRKSLNEAIEEIKVEKRKAESADRAKSLFLATISHEMRTPLNGIVGIAEILGETELDTEQTEMLRNLSYSSNMLYSLISDVLDLTTIEDENIELNENKFELGNEIRDLLEIFRPKIDSRKTFLHLHHEHDERIPNVLYGDIARVRQVIVNLVNNAVKFTNEGSIIVKTRLQKREGQTATIQFSVSDTGVGISEEDQEKLFSKFFRAKIATAIEGTGLGLTISKRLVEIMGGQISFTSQLNKGSTFTFELPFAIKSSTPDKVEEVSNNDDLSDLKILIAEDVAINQMILKKMLSNLGISEIDVVENGQLAVEKATKGGGNYDYILMDIQMPELDGSQASRKIIEFYRGEPPFKIIAVTANVLKEDFVHYRESGMVDVLSKPVNIKMLTHILHKYLPTLEKSPA